jgi:hypothetical protein
MTLIHPAPRHSLKPVNKPGIEPGMMTLLKTPRRLAPMLRAAL